MKEYLFRVGMKDRITGEKVKLHVWAENVDEATHKVTGALFGVNGSYIWIGSGPEYENNKLVERDLEA